MTLPIAMPDWLPWWVLVVLLVPLLLYFVAFLFMPFSVIGVKGRLDVLEARIDELHHELRRLALRMPEPVRQVDFDELYAPEPAAEPPSRRTAARPPIPPASHELNPDSPPPDRAPPPPNARPGRREPRLDWPR
ncbi:MAG: hypothetical protein JO227_17345 [Acetobacteraceae bacterium]|nr:hypothetical protein [Acetobacteraceae bacterium]